MSIASAARTAASPVFAFAPGRGVPGAPGFAAAVAGAAMGPGPPGACAGAGAPSVAPTSAAAWYAGAIADGGEFASLSAPHAFIRSRKEDSARRVDLRWK